MIVSNKLHRGSSWLLSVWLTVGAVLLNPTGGRSQEEPLGVVNIDQFEAGKGGYELYRIPGIVVTRRGTVLAYCEARKSDRGDWGPIDVLMRRSSDGGKAREPREKIVRIEGNLPVNPLAAAQNLDRPGDNTVNNSVAIVDDQTGVARLTEQCVGAGTDTDVCVYGGTSGGVVAAVQAARMGKRVVLVEPGRHLGGMTAGGLSAVDIGDPRSVGGIAREYFTRLVATYGKRLQWTKPFQKKGGPATGGVFSIEPHVAERLFEQMVREAGVVVLREARLKSVTKMGNRIVKLHTDDGRIVRAKMFLDTTYEGDLMAAAGVTCTVKREGNAKYGEQYNGIHYSDKYRPRWNHLKPGPNGRVPGGQGVWDRDFPLDPYVVKGDPSSGLLPLVSSGDPGTPGEPAPGVMAYCFRLCLTTAEDRLPIKPPPDYDANRYEVVVRFIEACQANGDDMDLRWFAKYDPLPNQKWDFNTATFGANLPGASWEWPEAGYDRRAEIAKEHENYHRGLLHFLATDPRVPERVRGDMARFGLPRDEFTDNGGWPHQIYVREGRRMVSDLVMTEHHTFGRQIAPRSIGLGSYGTDVHEIRRIVKDGVVTREGKVAAGRGGAGPYPIGYGAIVPRREECENLFVTFALSASHTAFASIRMEPVFMVTSQSAATAACLAIDENAAVQDVPYERLESRLLADGQVLKWESVLGTASPRPVVHPKDLPGIVLDDTAATYVGDWTVSNRQPSMIGTAYRHDNNQQRGEKSATFIPDLPEAGEYEVRLLYTWHPNRSSKTHVTVVSADGTHDMLVNQRKPCLVGDVPVALGTFRFEAGKAGRVTISNRDADGYVVVDGVQFLPATIAREERDGERPSGYADIQMTARPVSSSEQLAARAAFSPLARVTRPRKHGTSPITDTTAGDMLLALRQQLRTKTSAPPFPAKLPATKPTDRPLSAAVHRLYDQWNPLGDRGNELYSNFKYSPLEGFSYENNTSRRDPSKVLRIHGTYYVWYTRRRTDQPPRGPQHATDTTPSYDWDLAEIWYATSKDGFDWVEQGAAVKRLPKPQYGWRSVSTPDILVWGGKYYLYYQGFNEIPGLKGDRAATTVAVADSPDGPWKPLGKVVVDFGADDEWDSNAIHDPYPLVYHGKVYLYYKGSPGKGGRDGTLVRAQGLAVADHPLGPFTKCPLNPVLNSGHETCLWPWKGGIAAMVSLDGPEKNTVQFAADGVNFQMKSILQIPPIAPGPFVPDAFADNDDGRGFTWGLCHINPDGGGSANHSVLARFDCDLSRDVDRPLFKHNNLRFNEQTYLQERVRLPEYLKNRRVTGVARSKNEEAERHLPTSARAFPAVMPKRKPADRPLSAAWARMWDPWNPHEDRGNELYSNFKYTPLEGFSREPNVSRRDPSKVLMVNGTYYVWYTCRRSKWPPAGLAEATDEIPGTDWDLANIEYATSQDGFTWKEQGIAVRRPSKPTRGFRSICTPDVLVWKGKYYLYFQAYSPMVGGQQYCPVMVAMADSPDGPWKLVEKPVIEPGPPGAWDDIKINDPYLLVYKGKIWMFYKGAPIERGEEYVLRMQGTAWADNPLGPFTKSPLNPVINSGHETCMWPWKSGIAALVALDGPEKNTIQFAADGENFEIASIIQVPPVAPGPYIPDAFADNGNGRGFTWGLCHINPDGGGATNESILARFDCDLSLDVDQPFFKRNNLRFEESTYFQPRVRLPDNLRRQIEREREQTDRDTIMP